MSFILDALRKSETERQQQVRTEFAGVPGATPDRRAPRWLWLLGLLLAINLAALVGIMMRPDLPAARDVETPPVPEPATASDASTPTFSDRVDAARRNRPAEQPEPPRATTTALPKPAVRATIIAENPAAVNTSEVYPTLQEVIVSGDLSLPALHLDIHVFSDTPTDRFVFVNMSKYREGDVLAEGPAVVEIRPDGVVLRHNRTTFLLPRE